MKDDFEITKHETSAAIGDYYENFTLKISENDKKALFSEFKLKASDTLKNRNFIYSENEFGFTKERKNVPPGDRELIFIPKTKEKILEYQLIDE
ncbi:hypothetical protein [Kaistella montana]|uniref:Uncharacterized protein n=1 Tax=Kaistella montana TaxID=1849733 RepID=A0ABW5KAD0_9FLAO|nr:hypothetical protein [Kaistella montana]MCQ4035433.1 hypothetical protein [Kaistella montana]